jgi:hypothetical protein
MAVGRLVELLGVPVGNEVEHLTVSEAKPDDECVGPLKKMAHGTGPGEDLDPLRIRHGDRIGAFGDLPKEPPAPFKEGVDGGVGPRGLGDGKGAFSLGAQAHVMTNEGQVVPAPKDPQEAVDHPVRGEEPSSPFHPFRDALGHALGQRIPTTDEEIPGFVERRTGDPLALNDLMRDLEFGEDRIDSVVRGGNQHLGRRNGLGSSNDSLRYGWEQLSKKRSTQGGNAERHPSHLVIVLNFAERGDIALYQE